MLMRVSAGTGHQRKTSPRQADDVAITDINRSERQFIAPIATAMRNHDSLTCHFRQNHGQEFARNVLGLGHRVQTHRPLPECIGKVLQGPELRTIYLGMDVARDELLFSNVKGKNPFKDLRVRQAMALAVDAEAIVSRVMRGQGRATWLLWGPGVNGYNAAMDVRPKVDIAKAKALLAEAGYPQGFEVTLDCSNDRYIADEQICVALSAMWARIGMKVNVFARTKVKFFADIGYPGYNTSLYMLGWTPSTYDADNVMRDHIVSRNKIPGLGIGNVPGYSNDRVDQLEQMIAQELDATKRNGMINEVAKIVQDELPFIPLHQQGITWAARNNIALTQPADNSFPMRWVTKK